MVGPLLLGLSMIFCLSITVPAQAIELKAKYQPGDFKLVYGKQAADILISADDLKVVSIVANDLATDVERVANIKPRVRTTRDDPSKNIVIIGTLGKSSVIDDLVKRGKIDISRIKNKWESFQIETIPKPFPGVENAMIIAGSDGRGTAFGVYELSQRIGVSPWVWWADVAPDKRDRVVISRGKYTSSEPSVKYRGIFLNDEDWGLQPWAAKTLEPETGNIGPKTYARVCELLLRLKANTLWPAMHDVSTPFNANPANRQVADDYAIVMGSSHAEPMLRNNVGEWKAKPEEFNFVTNPAGVTDYWEQRVKENGKFENIYTIGMRGIHDSAIQGPKTQAERIPLLEKIFSVQRGLLSKYVNSDAEKVPQIFCPYKEVLADYRAGLNVPDDVTIVFPDDNFGYIRQFPNAEEQKRKGGFGVYYHISYLGRPLSYLWLNSTPPALVFEEMSKAYANGMRNLWILNVGDLKPAEIGIEFFMQMAYDANRWNVGDVDQYLKTWESREFGDKDAVEIAKIMDKYYRLGFQRKPEHLQWYIPGEKPRKSDLTEDETLERLRDYASLRKRAEDVYAKISSEKKDAFYELVLYPVRSAALANERFFGAELAARHFAVGNGDSMNWAERSAAADRAIAADAHYFNDTLANGKWRHIMSPEMTPGQWTSMRTVAPKISPSEFDLSKIEERKVLVDNFRPEPSAAMISIEAEHFASKTAGDGFSWQIIRGLGKTGDSVSVFPTTAQTFADLLTGSPSLTYKFNVATAGDFTAQLYFLPTQPMFTGTGLRVAFSIDGGQPQVLTVDKDTEVSSAKWAVNILNETTAGTTSRLHLEKGAHILRLFAVETGVVIDKIVFSTGELPTSYFGPPETLVH